jgi:hypothetical protein
MSRSSTCGNTARKRHITETNSTLQEHTMKIQIVKKGNAKVKATGHCPMFVDIPPDAVTKK